jgi:hypothetical protein
VLYFQEPQNKTYPIQRSVQKKKNIDIIAKNWSGVLAGRHLWSHTPMSSSECELTTLLSLFRLFRTLRIGRLLFFPRHEIHHDAPGQHQIPVKRFYSNGA